MKEGSSINKQNSIELEKSIKRDNLIIAYFFVATTGATMGAILAYYILKALFMYHNAELY